MDNKITALYYRTAHNSNNSAYIDNQMQKLMDYANANGTDGFVLYADFGFNGVDLDRPALAAMLNDAVQGRLRAVVFSSASRLGRGIRAVCEITEIFSANGVEFIDLSGTTFEAYGMSTEFYCAIERAVKAK